jgi:hypothetical protein
VSDLQKQINQRIDAFVNEIAELARQQALETLSSALGGRGKAGRRVAAAALPLSLASSRGKGEKRSRVELNAVTDGLAAKVTSKPGLRIEQLARELGTPTKELSLPMRKLVAEGRVRSEGQRRATRYFPGNGSVRRKRRGKRAKG